jgi:hypothetical protein
MSRPPTSVWGPVGRTGGGVVRVAGAVAAGGVLVARGLSVVVLEGGLLEVVPEVGVVVDGEVLVPSLAVVASTLGDEVVHAVAARAATTPPTRARPIRRGLCGIPHCVPSAAVDRGGSAAAPCQGVRAALAHVGMDHPGVEDPVRGIEVI